MESQTDFGNDTTTIDYDPASRTQTTSYADGSQIIIRYNMSGKIIEAIGESGTIRYTYDKAGLLETQTDDEAGETSYYTYDNAGRRKSLVSGNRQIAYTYGKNGELLHVADSTQQLFVTYTYNVMMREITRTFGNGVIQSTEYDVIGRTTLITEKNPLGNILRAEGYLYNTKGQRSHNVNEEGKVTQYFYDGQGRLETVYYPYSDDKLSLDTQLATVEYNELKALLEKMSFGRGNSLTIQQNILEESYTYDANSNCASKTTPWGTIDYRYDSENRLVYSGVAWHNLSLRCKG